MYLRVTIIYVFKFQRILKIMGLDVISFSDFLQLLFLFIQKCAMKLLLSVTIFSENGTICYFC